MTKIAAAGLLTVLMVAPVETLAQHRAPLPAGSYHNSCDRASVGLDRNRRLTLYAQCRTVSGAWKSATLLLPCQGDIFNADGRLRCQPAAFVRARAELYVDRNYRGASLVVDRDMPDLGTTRFDDNVSSIRIVSGRWEVCPEPYFQGACRVLTASYGNLNTLHLNDRISSIRPVSP